MAQSQTASERPHVAAKRYIYAWGAGTAEGHGKMKDLLGGKGAGLAEMTLAGLPPRPATTTSPAASSCRPGSGTTSSTP
jgi:pyruvate,orthophosphate dikinase